jgi:hypothetical protein
MRIVSALLALCLTLTSVPARAWNDRGHMTVAAIAWEFMTPRARERAIQLLRLNPDYRGWLSGSATTDREEIAFMRAATWPDKLRGRVCDEQQPRPGCSVRDDRYRPADADAEQNIGYADHRLRAYWHFINLPYSSDGTREVLPFSSNAETQIIAFSQSLSNGQIADEAKSFNLTWLLHIVGDVHQPLHATAWINRTFPDGDGGGNGTNVCRPAPETCVARALNLHKVWDRMLGEQADAASALVLARSIAAQLRQPNSELSQAFAAAEHEAPAGFSQKIHKWMEQSRTIAIRFAYVDPVRPGQGLIHLTDTYIANARQQAMQRAAVGGRRLAELLNRALG